MAVKRIIDLVEDSSPTLDDYVAVDNSSPNSTRRTRLSDLLASAGPGVFMQKAQNLADLADTGTAQDNIQIGATFADVATAQGATIPARNKRIRTQFYATANRIGGAQYRRISFADLGSTPALAYFRSADRFMPDGSTDNTNGGYWVIDEAVKQPSMLSAKVDGTTNDTAACNAAVSLGGTVLFDPGVTTSNQITVSVAKTNILIPGSATVKLFAGGSVDIANFFFTSGGQDSYIGGAGRIDGNRSALLSAYLALPRTPQYGGASYVIDVEYDGIRAEPCANLTIDGLTIVNCMTHAITHRGGDDLNVRNIRVKDCSKVLNVQFCARPQVRNIRGTGIGNLVGGTAIPFWQPAFEVRDIVEPFFEDWSIEDFAPSVRDSVGDVIGDPIPTAFTFERITGGKIATMHAVGYTFNPASNMTTSHSSGFYLSSLRGVKMSSFRAEGYFYGVNRESLADCSLEGVFLDGRYNTVPTNVVLSSADSTGMTDRNAGIYPFATPLPDNDYRANTAGEGCITSNGTIRRFTDGVRLSASCLSMVNVQSYGNLKNGWVVARAFANPSFPNAENVIPMNVTLTACGGYNNGHNGLVQTEGVDVRVIGGRWDNNGQETATGSLKNGFAYLGAGPIVRPSITGGVNAGDTQSFTRVKAASFAPGATDASNKFTVLLNQPAGITIGQRLLIKNGSGSGDIQGKVVDIDRDLFTLQTAAPATFADTGNLTALSGTISSSGVVVTGVSTSFLSQIPGPVFLKAGGQYRRIAKVYSNTSLQLVSAFSPDISAGASAQVVLCDVAGVPCQLRPIYAESAVQDLAWNDVAAPGASLVEFIQDFASLAAGQVFNVENETNVSTTQPDTLLTSSGFQNYIVCLEISYIVVQDIVGTNGTSSLGVGSNTSSTMGVVGLPLTKNTKWAGPMPLNYSKDFVYPTMRLEGGADNIASGGRVKSRLRCKRVGVPVFANVP